MIFAEPFALTKTIIKNDPEDFRPLYETPSQTDLEIQQWAYHRLHNRPNHLQHVRCRNIIFGQIGKR